MDVIELTNRLIAIPSVSVDSNLAVTNELQELLGRWTSQIERNEYVDSNGVRKYNLLAKIGSGVGGVVFFAHNDVVPVPAWTGPTPGPFAPAVVDGKLYGRGACDMKGPFAAALVAIEKAGVENLKQPIYFVCTADEERGSRGAREVFETSKMYRQIVAEQVPGIITEPTEMQIVHAHKGTYCLRIVARGRAAHSSTREGINANLAMIPFLMEMKAIHDETVADPIWLDDRFDPPWMSWNILMGDHDTAVNITPPESECRIFFRPMPDQPADELIDRVRQLAEKAGLEFEVCWKYPPLFTPPESPFVQDLLKVTGEPTSRTVSYGTDGIMYHELANLVVLGPGSIKQAHTSDEWISTEELHRGVDVYTNVIRRSC